MSDQEKKYPFLFTALPHGFTDSWMGRLSPEATVVMLAFYRETIGWERTEAAVSFPTLQAYTGIASYTTIKNAIQELCNAELIRPKQGERTPRNGVIYELLRPAISFTPDVKVKLSKDRRTFTPDGKLPLHHMEKYPYKPRKSSVTPHVKRKPPLKHRQPKPKAAPEDSEQGAKERLKEPSKIKEKEQQSSPLAQTGAPSSRRVDIKIENEEHEAAQTQEDAPIPPSEPTLDTIPTKPAGPSAEELAAHRLAAEQAEKQRMRREQARAEEKARQQRASLESSRDYFAGALATAWKKLVTGRATADEQTRLTRQEQVNEYSRELSRVLQELEG